MTTFRLALLATAALALPAAPALADHHAAPATEAAAPQSAHDRLHGLFADADARRSGGEQQPDRDDAERDQPEAEREGEAEPESEGMSLLKEELEKRCGFKLGTIKPYTFTSRKDHYGWKKNHQGKWYFTLFVENGRVLDDEQVAMKTALLEIAKTGKANFRFTGNQNVIIADVLEADKPAIEKLLNEFKLDEHTANAGALRKNAIACVAFNTCPLALAEAQRYLPTLIDKIEPILTKHGLQNDEIILRMTGCPNGCGRSPAAEIGFVGTAYGQYNLHIGGDREGERLNTKYKDSLNEEEILTTLDELFEVYSKERNSGETFGDFSQRKWILN